ncbi:nucleolar protein 12 [Anoplophora glabripennis]|uniref:nucleolar protein 12 n=1 Tax=Anoplophora glabripennis TaxID=217634 RepID=UPI000874DD63|nr:nucleolar protein 12 [Anoplophora glabripennis]
MASGNAKRSAKKPKNRKNKVVLVFDENKRRDFLTGFHKRKLQRKKDAKEKFEKELKEERKRIKAEAKESYKKLVVSHRPIPELENLISEEYENDDVTVKVVELASSEIANKNHWIGANQPKYDANEEESSEESHNEDEEVPGMELKPKKKSKEKQTEKVEFQTEKDVKKALKKQATKTVKKSKVFQMKNKLERQKQKKKSLQMKKQRMKFHKSDKGHRRKKGNE